MEITFVNTPQNVSIEDVWGVFLSIEEIVGKYSGEISLMYTNKAYMTELNTVYRGKNEPTNVLAFPLGDEEYVLGDIVICETKACTPEKQTMESCEDEIRYLVIHAVLHLLGYDHQEEEEFEEMHTLEKRIWEHVRSDIARSD